LANYENEWVTAGEDENKDSEISAYDYEWFEAQASDQGGV